MNKTVVIVAPEQKIMDYPEDFEKQLKHIAKEIQTLNQMSPCKTQKNKQDLLDLQMQDIMNVMEYHYKTGNLKKHPHLQQILLQFNGDLEHTPNKTIYIKEIDRIVPKCNECSMKKCSKKINKMQQEVSIHKWRNIRNRMEKIKHFTENICAPCKNHIYSQIYMVIAKEHVQEIKQFLDFLNNVEKTRPYATMEIKDYLYEHMQNLNAKVKQVHRIKHWELNLKNMFSIIINAENNMTFLKVRLKQML